MRPAISAHTAQVDVGIVSRGLPDGGPGTVARADGAGKSRVQERAGSLDPHPSRS